MAYETQETKSQIKVKSISIKDEYNNNIFKNFFQCKKSKNISKVQVLGSYFILRHPCLGTKVHRSFTVLADKAAY